MEYRPTSTSLDQIATFVAVVDNRSFSGAARARGRAQPAVTLAIRGLENRLGFSLFDRSTYRPTLTSAGSALLPYARRLLGEAEALDQAAAALLRDDHHLSVVMDGTCPGASIAQGAAMLKREFPNTQLRLATASLDEVPELVSSGRYTFGVCSSFSRIPDQLQRMRILDIGFALIVAEDHPLTCLPAVSNEALRAHEQVVLMSTHGDIASRDFGVISTRTIAAGDLSLLLEMVRAGMGYAIIPDHVIDGKAIHNGLRKLQIGSWLAGWALKSPVYLLWRGEIPLVPIARRFLDIVASRERN